MQRHCGAQITAACSQHHLVHAVMAFTTAYGWCGATEVAATFLFIAADSRKIHKKNDTFTEKIYEKINREQLKHALIEGTAKYIF